MISLVEAVNFRCLRKVRQSLEPFQILVGPNASGKTTFLEAISFIGQLVSEGLEAAVSQRTNNFRDLVWGRSGSQFELTLAAPIPPHLMDGQGVDQVGYHVEIRLNETTGELEIGAEKVVLVANPHVTNESLYSHLDGRRVLELIGKEVIFYPEKYPANAMRHHPLGLKFGSHKSALGNLPEDESLFPVTTWLKSYLTQGVQSFTLNSQLLRKASPPGQTRGFKPDGSNLPWVIHRLQQSAPDRVTDWIAHLQTALPDLEGIRTVEREDDRHRYLMLRYRGGLEVPSWSVSDGTLRLLALTLPAYLTDFEGVYLIEEPENGIHPRAIETMYQSLSSVYGAQILMATHSPIILGMAEVESVLCFTKNAEGATEIVRGDQHPRLREWHRETDLGVLFASGVLG